MAIDIENFKQEFLTSPPEVQEQVINFYLFLKWKNERQLNNQAMKKPEFGCGSVKGTISPDFDEPLEDFKDYM